MEENKNGIDVCSVCKKQVSENYNFCPYCGKPLTDLAKELIKTQIDNNRLEVLIKLIDNVDDEKTLKLIKSMVKKISEK